ncbi:MAG: glutamyl-tRNA reductase [Oceanipulchritudo sp.]
MLPDSTRLITVGCNHQTTPLDLREQMALSHEDVAVLQEQLRNHRSVREAAILNTCNRVEIYAVTGEEAWARELASILQEINGFPADQFLRYAYAYENLDAVRHAYRVAAGLDSQIIGETQILGQMKATYASSIDQKTVGPVLHRFFQKAFQAAKWARTETHIGTGQVSLGNVAVELATRIFGRLTVSRTLVIGSGEAGRDVAKAFRSRGVACMSIASRTAERAEKLARAVDGLIIPFKAWEETLPYVDVGIFATASRDCLLDRSIIEQHIGRRPRKPLFLIDLAVPRDISPEVAAMPNIYLYNLEDLASIANENLQNRKQEMESCLQELDTKAAFMWKKIAPPAARNGQLFESSTGKVSSSP